MTIELKGTPKGNKRDTLKNKRFQQKDRLKRKITEATTKERSMYTQPVILFLDELLDKFEGDS